MQAIRLHFITISAHRRGTNEKGKRNKCKNAINRLKKKKLPVTRQKENKQPLNSPPLSTNPPLRPAYRNPLLLLAFLCGIVILPILVLFPPSPILCTPPLPLSSLPPSPEPSSPLTSLNAARVLLLETPPFLSSLSCFQPSNSRSRRNACSFSSLSSRSARRAASWLVESELWSSSMVWRRRSTLSRDLLISSSS
jgi:hypothetical protein